MSDDATSASTAPSTELGTAAKTDPRLLELLVCPLTKTTLIYLADRQELVSLAARLAYPIRDGMPLMLVEEARVLDDDDPIILKRR